LQAIFDIVDGCAVQYRCGVVLYVLTMISYSMNVHYTRCVQAPGHGKEEVDGLIGTEKTYADTIFARPGRHAKEDPQEHDIEAPIHRMDNGIKSSLAMMLYNILSNPKRKFRYKGEDQKVKERQYHYRPVDEATSHNVKMRAIGFNKAKGRYGIGSHFCFMADPSLGLHCATRRFFCSCNGCRTKLLFGTIDERYNGPFDQCKNWPIYKINGNEGWNDVRILSFQPSDDCNVDELEHSLVHPLQELGKTISRNIIIGGIGAYAVDDADRYYLVKWIEEPQEVEADEIVIVEDAPMMIFKGDWICKGRWLDQVVRAKYWYTVGATVVTVRMKNVLHADLLMSPISYSNKFPRVHQSVRNHVLPLKPHKLLPQDHDYMMDEIT
jgi:hypothetical protein